jgi:hypothetical protein
MTRPAGTAPSLASGILAVLVLALALPVLAWAGLEAPRLAIAAPPTAQPRGVSTALPTSRPTPKPKASAKARSSPSVVASVKPTASPTPRRSTGATAVAAEPTPNMLPGHTSSPHATAPASRPVPPSARTARDAQDRILVVAGSAVPPGGNGSPPDQATRFRGLDGAGPSLLTGLIVTFVGVAALRRTAARHGTGTKAAAEQSR